MSQRILVTGATGFVGAHVCYQALQLGWHVTAIKRSTSQLNGFNSVAAFYDNHKNPSIDFLQKLKQELQSFNDGGSFYQHSKNPPTHSISTNWVDIDLDNPIEVNELLEHNTFDYVFHAAASVTFDSKAKQQVINDNVLITKNIVNACLLYNKPTLVHVSSIAALGRPANLDQISINTMWVDSDYNTSYAISKHLSEMEVWRGAHEGLPVLVVNPGVILGYSETKNSSNQVIDAATNSLPFIPGGSNGFIFVEDLVYRTLNLMSDVNNYNCRHLMVTHNISFKNLIETICNLKGIKKKKWMLQGILLRLTLGLVKTLERFGLALPVSSELLLSTSKQSIYDNRIGHTQSRKLA